MARFPRPPDDATVADGGRPAPPQADVFGGRMAHAGDVGDTHERRAVLAAVQRRLLGQDVADATRIDRFVVLRRLGAGAMGVVYAAYDPRLDRKVALKLLLSDGRGRGTDGGPGHQRLVREAKTLAKLSHPNVVAVHEVGEFEGRIYIAMAFVDGETLGRWLGRGDRRWPEVLAKFCAAGQGLAAAHDAGLVHRDFKPENVLVDRDQGVHVADFGLARGLPTDPDATRPSGTPPHASFAADDQSLTGTGALVGTPAYMAPEQYASAPASARADQFSFCVALYEGLYGERPFAGTSVGTLAGAVAAGRVGRAPAGSRVPRWVRRAVVRGLAADPDARWPDMHALLEALGRNPLRAWRRRATATATVAFAGLGIAAWAGRAAPVARCSGLHLGLVGTWDQSRKQEIRDALLASPHPAAQRVWPRIDAAMSRYADAWVSARTQACLAPRVQGSVGDATLDRQVLCLDRARFALAAAARRFAAPDDAVVFNADALVPRTDAIERCGRHEVLETGVAPPADATARARIAATEAEIADIGSLRIAGHADTLLERSLALLSEAQDIGYAPTQARALLEHGMVLTGRRELQAAREAFGQAVVAAERGRADLTRALALRMLAKRAADLGALGEARRRADQANAALDRFGAVLRHRQSALSVDAYVAHAEGRVEDAATQYETSLQLARAAFDDDPAQYLLAVSAWAPAAVDAGRPLATIDATLTEAIDQTSELWGELHPDVAVLYSVLSAARLQGGDTQGARAAIEHSLAIRRSLVGPDDPSLTGAMLNYGVVAYQLGHHDDALLRYEQAIEVVTRTQGPDSLELPPLLHNAGLALHKLGRLETMVQYDQRALRIRQTQLGQAHPKTADAHYNLGLSYSRAGDHHAALRHYAAALTVHDPAAGVESRIAMAEALCALQLCAQGRESLEVARATVLELGLPETTQGRVEFALALALDADGEPDQAVALALRARRRLADAHADPVHLVPVEAWLAAH